MLPDIGVAERVVAGAVGLALAVAGVLWARRADRRKEQPIDPLFVFLAVWGFALVLFAVPWIRFSQTSLDIWIAVYGSILAFSLTYLVAMRRLGRRDAEPVETEVLSIKRLHLVWVGCLLLGLVGFAFYLRAVDAVVGVDKIFTDSDEVRAIQTSSAEFDSIYGRWRLLIYFNQISLLVWSIALRAGAFRGRWRLLSPLGLLAVVPFMFTGERTLLATAVVWIVFFHMVWKPLRNWRRAVAGAGVVVVLLAVAFVLIGSRQDKTIDSHPEISGALTTQTFREGALAFLYVTGNIPALSQLSDAPEAPETYGQMTLLPGVKLVNALTGIGGEPPEEVGAFYPMPFETFNNYTWLGTFYLDFGLVGCLLLPALCGLLAALVADWTRRRRSLLAVWMLSLALYVIAFTPLLNKISTTLTWQYVLLGPILVPILLGRSPGEMLARLRGLRARRPVIAGATVAGVLLLSVTAFGTDNPGPITDAGTLEKRLQIAADRAELIYDERGKLPGGFALGSALHVADPAVRYPEMVTFDEEPPERGSIGVFTTRGGEEAWLWGRATDGAVRGVHLILSGEREGRFLVRRDAENLLRNGGFEQPLEKGWRLTEARNADVLIDPGRSWSGDASLRLKAKRRPADTGGFLTQLVRDLPDNTEGARYTLRMHALASGLNRPLPAALRLNYLDGSSDFFPASVGTHGEPPADSEGAIVDSRDGFWLVATAIGEASRPVESAQVYLYDTGTLPLTGRVFFDAVSLVVNDGIPSFPPPR